LSITDPWAAVETEPAAEPQTEQKAVGTMTVDVKPNILTGELEPAITTTYKGGTGFDAPWVVTRASSVKEADALLDQEFADYLAKVQRVAKHFVGSAPVSQNVSPSQGGSAPARSNAPQGATEAPSWAPPKPHDDFVYKTNISAKTGKVWHAWMPPTKDDQRPAKFFYPPN
jgi:hypothetical protein